MTDREFILHLQEQLRQHLGGTVPVDPPPPPPPPPPPTEPQFPAGALLAQGVSTWFRPQVDYVSIDSPGGSLEVVLANLSEVADMDILYPNGSLAVRATGIIGGGGRWVRNGPPGLYRVRVMSAEPGVIKYWVR